MSLKILFLTGSRGEWGYIRPLLSLCRGRRDVKYSLCVTNMHLLPDFGLSKQVIEQDGYKIDHTIYMSLDGYNHVTMVKSLGILLMSLADIIATEKPDWIILAGDRGEQLIGAVAGAFCYIPVAHIQAGELSGNIDGMTRHAIGKFAHLHFASNQDAATRLERLGEQKFRIHLVGAPQLDELIQGRYSSKVELRKSNGIELNGDYILMLQHPVTEEVAKAPQQINLMMDVLNEFDMPKVAIFPNNDAGSTLIRDGIVKNRRGRFHVFSNLRREDYLGILKNASCIVGNSSSGIIEAPTFKIPAVNLGRRQNQRVRGTNVIDAPFEREAIRNALKKALSPTFRNRLQKNCSNPYGDGTASQQILNILLKTPITDELLIKNLTY